MPATVVRPWGPDDFKDSAARQRIFRVLLQGLDEEVIRFLDDTSGTSAAELLQQAVYYLRNRNPEAWGGEDFLLSRAQGSLSVGEQTDGAEVGCRRVVPAAIDHGLAACRG